LPYVAVGTNVDVGARFLSLLSTDDSPKKYNLSRREESGKSTTAEEQSATNGGEEGELQDILENPTIQAHILNFVKAEKRLLSAEKVAASRAITVLTKQCNLVRFTFRIFKSSMRRKIRDMKFYYLADAALNAKKFEILQRNKRTIRHQSCYSVSRSSKKRSN